MNKPAIPHLIALTEGTSIPLDKPILLVGRHQECDVQIPSRKISRRHCCIALITDHLVVRDLGSTNGIRINGIKVVEGNLQQNDELTIGNMRYQVKWGDPEAMAATARPPLKAAAPPAPRPLATDESVDEPVALPEIAAAHSSSQPKAPSKSGPFDLPDDIPLAPLNPPQK